MKKCVRRFLPNPLLAALLALLIAHVRSQQTDISLGFALYSPISSAKKDPCASSPCQNGICTSNSTRYNCVCPKGQTGPHCEFNTTTVCDQNPCLISINANSTGYYLNGTYHLIRQAYSQSKVFDDSVRQNMDSVADLLQIVSKSRQDNYTEVQKKSEADSVVSIVSECMSQAANYNASAILNSTQRMSSSLEKFMSSALTANSYTASSANMAILSYSLNNSEQRRRNGFKMDWNSTRVDKVERLDSSKSTKLSAVLDLSLVVSAQPNANKDKPTRVSFIVYETSVLFDVDSAQTQTIGHGGDCSRIRGDQIVSNVVSVSADAHLASHLPFVTTQFRTLPSAQACHKRFKAASFRCVFWDYARSAWSTHGCTHSLSSADADALHTCTCNHLTNFAILVSFDGGGGDEAALKCKACDIVLTYVSYVGNALSILGLCLTIAVYLRDHVKKSMNKKLNASEHACKFMFDYYVQILVSLSVSLLALNVLYVVFTFLSWNAHLVSCMVFGVLLHYFLLSAFCWMLCFAILQYLTFNKVLFVIDRFFLMSSIFSAAFPLVPIVIVLAVNWKLYQSPTFLCWLTGVPALLAVVCPILLIVAVNVCIFALILRKHCTTTDNTVAMIATKGSNAKRQTAILSTCFVNMGLTWLFGFALVLPGLNQALRVALTFLFCLFNSLQGFLIFLVYIVLSKSRRKYFTFAASEKMRKLKSKFASSHLFTLNSSVSSKMTESEAVK